MSHKGSYTSELPSGPSRSHSPILPQDLLCVRYFLKLALVAAIYFLAGKIGLSMPYTSVNVSPVWPPSGVALAALLVWGYRMWPGIALGAFLVNFLSPIPHSASFGIAAGNTAAATAAAFLLQRILNFRRSLRRLRDVLGLITFAAVVSTTIAASVGVTSLFLAHARPWPTFGLAWAVWWSGDAMGVLLVAPLALTLRQLVSIRGKPRIIEIGILVMGIAFTCLVTFDNRFGMKIGDDVLAFSVFPFVIWAAIRFGISGSAITTFLVAAISVWETANSSGPFVKHGSLQNAAFLQLFLAVISITGMILAAVVVEREQTERALGREQQLLERKVRAEHALRVSEERLLGIVSSAMDGIITVNNDQRIVMFNSAAEQIFRCSASEVIGQPIEKFIPERFREIHRQHIHNFGCTGVTSRSMYSPGALFGLRTNGEEFPIEATISQVETVAEKLYTVILRDISARKRVEVILEKAIEKLVHSGEQVGVSPQDMVALLDSGMSIRQLLDYLASKAVRRPA